MVPPVKSRVAAGAAASPWRLLVAPLLLIAAHLVVWRTGLYSTWPRIDVLMHLAGGCIAAGVISGALDLGAARGLLAGVEGLVRGLLVFGLVTVVAVGWEFWEYGLDRLLVTHFQSDLTDTMRDLALGMMGAVAYLAFSRRDRA